MLTFSFLWSKKVRYVLLKAALIYGVTFVIVLPLLCRNLPYSKYFSSPVDIHKKVYEYNQRRIKQAEDYLSKVDLENVRKRVSPRTARLQLAIGVVSVERQKKKSKTVGTQYLTQVMARLHEAIRTHGVQDKTFMFICNVEKNGVEHKEADYLSKYFHVRRFPRNRTRHEKMSKEREKENYAFCLESAATFKADYVLLLQDDALPHSNFYEVLDYLLKNKLERKTLQGQYTHGENDWVWMKLNFPDNLADFHRSPYFAYEWIALSLTGASVLSLIYHLTTGHETFPTKSRKLALVLNIVFILSFCYFFLAFWLIGRPYFLRLYGLSKHFTKLTPGTSCCLPAVVFPRIQIQGLVDYLNTIRCTPMVPLDFALDAYREKTKLKQYLAVPNLFSHIGYFSALHQGVNSQDAYAFLIE
ncbi:transmembrane protein 246-like [Asterias rubens]|uniref:transmembrane protein 246-like n=1 Tax=Asterias rubens TaxID=7604 RepID=UPI0014553E24|nr:transmembrane protein 246-like [Asterias rubens]